MAAPSFVNTIFGIAKMLGAKSGWTKDERLGIIDDLKVRAEQMVSVTALTEAGNERGSRKSDETHVAPGLELALRSRSLFRGAEKAVTV